jgi:GTP-binding protein
MSALHQARFFTTVDRLNTLPLLGLPELAFAGRSNAGKSTAINMLANQKRLAFASKTPGRTQHINFFAVGIHPEDPDQPAAFLVDLPGYGYAQVARDSRAHWGETLGTYIRKRNELTGLVLIMDARRGFTDLDEQLLAWFSETGKPVHVLLTKSDKLNRNEKTNVLRQVRARLAELSPFHTAQLFSALDRTGVEEADRRVLDLLGMPADEPADATALQVSRGATPQALRAPAHKSQAKKTPAQGE